MGRKASGKEFEILKGEPNQLKEVFKADQIAFTKIFTCINKDFISVQDFQENSGLSREICISIVNQIKSVSDIFHIAGSVHRTDYYLYIVRNFIKAEEDEILSGQRVLDVDDIMKIFDCGRGKAQSIIRSIKSVSDIARCKGKVTVTDYEKWFSGHEWS